MGDIQAGVRVLYPNHHVYINVVVIARRILAAAQCQRGIGGLGVVNKYNRGVAKANRKLEKNGNPQAKFDVNKLTEFRVTIIARPESGQIKPESGTIKWHDK